MPKVYDKLGKELTVGARVTLDPPHVPGERRIRGRAEVLTIELSSNEPHVGSGKRGSWFTTHPAQPTAAPYTYTCLHLLLIDSPTERTDG